MKAFHLTSWSIGYRSAIGHTMFINKNMVTRYCPLLLKVTIMHIVHKYSVLLINEHIYPLYLSAFQCLFNSGVMYSLFGVNIYGNYCEDLKRRSEETEMNSEIGEVFLKFPL